MICHISHICMFTALSLVLFQFYKGGRLSLPALPSTTRRSSGAIWSIVSFCLYIYCQIHTYIVKLPAQCFTVCWLKWSLQQSNFLQCSWPAGCSQSRCWEPGQVLLELWVGHQRRTDVFSQAISQLISWQIERAPFSFSVSATAAAPSSSSLLSMRSTSAGTGSDRKSHLWFHRRRMERKSDFFKTINSVQESQSSSSCGLAFLLVYWC